MTNFIDLKSQNANLSVSEFGRKLSLVQNPLRDGEEG